MLVQLIDARIMGRLSKQASIAKNARSSEKAEDAEDTDHYLDRVDEDDENEEGFDEEEGGEFEEAIEQLANNSNAARSFMNGALQSEPKKSERSKKKREATACLARRTIAMKGIRAKYDYDDGCDVEAHIG